MVDGALEEASVEYESAETEAPIKTGPEGSGLKQVKISLVEGVIMLLIVLPADLIFDPLLGLIPGINLVGILIDIPLVFIINFWLLMRGVPFGRTLWTLIGGLIEFIPYVDLLPIRTATLLVTIYLVNRGARVKEDKLMVE